MKPKNETSIYAINGDGTASKVEFKSLDKQQDLIWINTNVKSIKKILTKLKAPLIVAEVLGAKETRPRTLIHNDTLLASFRGINPNTKNAPEDMVSLRMWMHKNIIITVKRRPLAATAEIEKDLKAGVGPKTSANFLETLLIAMTDKSVDVISNLGDQLDEVEDALSEKADANNRVTLSNMRRRAILLRRYLIPQREAISRIAVDKLSWLSDINLMHLREITDSNTRLLEDLDAQRERATVIHEELFAQSQENMNNKMYLLTIIAVIFMPLSFLTGLLGINVGGIPGSTFKYGFLIVCVLLLGIFLLQWLYLKRKRWV